MKKREKIIPVILAGGVSKRLFPLCSEDTPKQFLKLKNGRTLFHETIFRNKSGGLFDYPIVLTQSRYKNPVKKNLGKGEVGKFDIILETSPKNTLPSIYLACLYLENLGKSNSVCAFLPSDHLITKPGNYRSAIKELSENIGNQIILIGINPEKENNQYGYIEYGSRYISNIFKVKKFIEKPKDFSVLKNKKNLLWNSGIYIAKAGIIRKEIEKYNSELCKQIEKIFVISGFKSGEILLDKGFGSIEGISIDYGLAQQSKIMYVYKEEKPIGWQDLGSFESLEKNKKYLAVNYGKRKQS